MKLGFIIVLFCCFFIGISEAQAPQRPNFLVRFFASFRNLFTRSTRPSNNIAASNTETLQGSIENTKPVVVSDPQVAEYLDNIQQSEPISSNINSENIQEELHPVVSTSDSLVDDSKVEENIDVIQQQEDSMSDLKTEVQNEPIIISTPLDVEIHPSVSDIGNPSEIVPETQKVLRTTLKNRWRIITRTVCSSSSVDTPNLLRNP